MMKVFAMYGLMASSFLSAAVITSYDSGVLPQAGASGAADPISQGWTYTGSGTGYSDGYDSGNGGYRTVDGTTTGASWYQYNLTAQNITDVTAAPGWTLSWTSSIDGSALLEGGGGVTNYYLPLNQSRVSSVAMWFELTGTSTYILDFRADASGNLVINDGTTDHAITTGGGNNAYNAFYDYTLSFDGTQATLAVAGTSSATSPIVMATSGVDTGNNRIIFGSYSNAGQGSVVWNDVELATIPEPSSIALVGLLGIALLIFRKRN